eukprot:474383_1
MLSLYSKIHVMNKFYDIAMSGIVKYFYKHPREQQLSLYKKHMATSKHHLEIGCSSIYLPVHASNDNQSTKYYLLDIEQTPLISAQTDMIKNSIPKENIQLICGNALEINRISMPNIIYDSVGISYVLHCIPTSLNEKLPLILNGLSTYMDENSIIFGSTICNPNDINNKSNIHHRFFVKWIQFLQYQWVMFNQNDFHSDLEKIFSQYFDEVSVERIGYASVFMATKLKNNV